MDIPQVYMGNMQFKRRGCQGNHIFIYCTHRGYQMRVLHNIHEASTMEDVVRNNPIIYASLDNRHEEYQSNMIDIEGKIMDQPISILINLRESNIYIVSNLVEIFNLEKKNHGKPWLV